MEMYKTYDEGRSQKDPGEFWFKGEFFFFDKHIIPLAERLKETGVFGKTADELLQNAKNNLKMWELNGEALVEKLKSEVREKGEADSCAPVVGGSIFSSLVQLCCRGSTPQYLKASQEDDVTETTESEDEIEEELERTLYAKYFRAPCFRGQKKKV